MDNRGESTFVYVLSLSFLVLFMLVNIFACFSECLSRLEHDPLLISAVGVDSQGEMVMDRLRELEMVCHLDCSVYTVGLLNVSKMFLYQYGEVSIGA